MAASGRRGTTPATIDKHADIASVSSESAAPGDDDDGSSSSTCWLPPLPPSPRPKLVLDSGASFHMVRDASLLSDLSDGQLPGGLTAVMAADGNTMPVTKVGNIRMPGFLTIPEVYLVPGLKTIEDGLVSVRQLARQSGISTCFIGDVAMLYAGTELVGVAVAVAPRGESLGGVYILQYLRAAMPENADERFRWSKFLPIRVHRRKKLRLRMYMKNLAQLRTLEARIE